MQLVSRILFVEAPSDLTGPGKLIFVCHEFAQDGNMETVTIEMIKITGNRKRMNWNMSRSNIPSCLSLLWFEVQVSGSC